MNRIRGLELPEMSVEQKCIYDKIMASRGGIRGPQGIWLRRPGFSDPAQELGAFCRFGTSLQQKLVELVIIMAAAHFKAQYEWFAHARLALKAGLNPDIVAAIRTGGIPAEMEPMESILYRFCRSLLRNNRVNDQLYQEALATFSENALIEIVGILGYYAMVAYTLNAFAVSMPPGELPPFAEPIDVGE